MRLIDADELKKELREFLVKDNHVNNPPTTYLDVLDVVEEQPTAYDIDKVVEKLEEKKIRHKGLADYERVMGTIVERQEHLKAIESLMMQSR